MATAAERPARGLNRVRSSGKERWAISPITPLPAGDGLGLGLVLSDISRPHQSDPGISRPGVDTVMVGRVFSRMRSSNHRKATVYQIADYERQSFGGQAEVGDARKKSRVPSECYNVLKATSDTFFTSTTYFVNAAFAAHAPKNYPAYHHWVDSGVNDRLVGYAAPRPIRTRHARGPSASRDPRRFSASRAIVIKFELGYCGPNDESDEDPAVILPRRDQG
ncbi:hypothetical protein EAG_10479 [Camponotus floridanus]|uniref:Uncharacterized protein n=1 Tax=Camponotus floridanus TaxID=104421 RepID=E2AC89_CAMFO|nr:hypothetical protein EAG_10479 [Camponotus floridanus]